MSLILLQCYSVHAQASARLTLCSNGSRQSQRSRTSVATLSCHTATSHVAAVAMKCRFVSPSSCPQAVSRPTQSLGVFQTFPDPHKKLQGVRGQTTSRHSLVGSLNNNVTSISPFSSIRGRNSRLFKVQATAAREGTDSSRPKPPMPPANESSILQRFVRQAVKQLSSFPLAIALLAVIAALCAVGTLVDSDVFQEASLAAMDGRMSSGEAVIWQVAAFLGFDHVYSSPIFLSLLVLLTACLTACTSSRQLPMLRVAQRWSFMQRPAAVKRLDFSETLERAQLADLATALMSKGYQVSCENGTSLYAFKGLAGRMAPIGVHAALVLIMAGGAASALLGFQGTVMLPSGLSFAVPAALEPKSVLARPSSSSNLLVTLDRFSIEYRPSGEVKQFFSDLRVQDFYGRELLKKQISVNDPLRCQNVTMYQTDWAISTIQLRVNGGDPLNLPMASLAAPGTSEKLFGAFLPSADGSDVGSSSSNKGISILARDLQTVVLYDSTGQFVGVRRPGSNRPIVVDGQKIIVDDVIGSSGLELKVDPGVPYVYAGFGALMLTSAISYLSHSQVWAIQDGKSVLVGGKTNRAKIDFEEELNECLDNVPEVLPVEVEVS